MSALLKNVEGDRGRAVYNDALDLLYTRKPITDEHGMLSYAGAHAKASSLTLYDKSWRIPTMDEMLLIVDLTRFNPAFNELFIVEHRGPIWTSTNTAWCDDKFWCIDPFTGKPLYQSRLELGQVLPVTNGA